MSYTMLNNDAIRKYDYASDSLEGAALSFIRDCCEKLRFDKNKATSINVESIDSEREGTSLKKNQIPFNMEKDIDRLCFENAINRFLKSGKNVCFRTGVRKTMASGTGTTYSVYALYS